MKKILILGAGMVAKPIVRYFLEQNISVTLGDIVKSKAEELIQGHPLGIAIEFNVEQKEKLDQLIAEHDVVVSILPWMFHPEVAKYCIKNKRHLVTSSYVKENMQSLDEEARRAGVLLLNELGLDPGLDHMSAKRIIDQVHENGGKILGFYSLCGALPAPESANNPFKYKFSWSPKGVIMAGNNSAKYLKGGKEVIIPTENLFKDVFHLNFPEIGILDAYPNRDSLSYIDLYQIPETLTMLRGTLRYPSWCETMDAMKSLGLTKDENQIFRDFSYADMIGRQIGQKNSENIKEKVAKFLNINLQSHALEAMEWLGLFEKTSLQQNETSCFEIISDLMIDKMKLLPDDKDMCVMQHQFLIETKLGKRETIKSSLLDFGSPKTDTSIARTVALPAAAGVKLLLDNKINLTGVHIPIHPEIYNPILEILSNWGISMKEQFYLPESEFIGFQHI